MNLCCMSNRDMVKTWVCSLDMMERSLCVPVSPVEGSIRFHWRGEEEEREGEEEEEEGEEEEGEGEEEEEEGEGEGEEENRR